MELDGVFFKKKEKSMMKYIVAVLVVFALSSCMTQRVYTGSGMGAAVPSYKKSQPFFVSGIAQTKEVNAQTVCQSSGVAKVSSTFTPLDIVLSVVTFGIYTPRTMEIYCNR